MRLVYSDAYKMPLYPPFTRISKPKHIKENIGIPGLQMEITSLKWNQPISHSFPAIRNPIPSNNP